MEKNNLSRRRFLQMTAVGSGSILLFPGCSGRTTKSHLRFFTEKEASLIDAITEQIIPTDEWPGAKDAGVINYIDKQLLGPYLRHQVKYRSGLAAVQASCNQLYGNKFESLSWDDQTEFLKKMEAGKLADLEIGDKPNSPENKIWKEISDKTFFGLIRDHSMQGFYGSPRHGGNKNYVSYKMIGLDYPFIIGQNRYKG